MKILKTSGMFDKSRNPYYRWGCKTLSIGEVATIPKLDYSYIKIITESGVFFFAGFDKDGNTIITDNLEKTVRVSKKSFNKIKRKIMVNYKEISLIYTTKKYN